VSPDGSRVYVTTGFGNTVTVIDGTTNNVITSINTILQFTPFGVSVHPDGSKVYVAIMESNTVLVIDTAINGIISTIPVGSQPVAFGMFVQPLAPPSFAGVPGAANCQGKSVSQLATKFGGLDAAAAALKFSSVQALQNAIRAFCAG
jgi:YVTN family beta-propeller protein